MHNLLLVLLISTTTFHSLAQGFNQASFRKMVDTTLSHSVTEVNACDFVQASDAVFLDARERNEYNVSKIKDAIWVGYNNFNLGRVQGLNKNDKIIVYCSIGYRSEKIAEKLIAAGFNNVVNMAGGIFEWANYEKLIVDSTESETNKVHAYDIDWGKWLDENKVEKIYDGQ